MILDFRFRILDFLKRQWRLALPIGAVALAFLVVFPYYTWKTAIRRAAQAELLNQQQAGEIAALRAGAVAREAQATARDGRIKELAGEVEKSAVRSRQLAAELAAAKAAAAVEQARIKALPAEQVGPELQKTVPTAGVLRFAQDDSEGARRVLEIIGQRDSCREQSALQDQQLANCEDRNSLFEVQRSELLFQVRDLKQALDLEKRAFEQRDDLAKKQVKAAGGTWVHRAWNRVKFPLGIGIGVVITAVATR
jgi:hypothetical protein